MRSFNSRFCRSEHATQNAHLRSHREWPHTSSLVFRDEILRHFFPRTIGPFSPIDLAVTGPPTATIFGHSTGHSESRRIRTAFPLLQCLRTPKLIRLQDFAYYNLNFFSGGDTPEPPQAPRYVDPDTNIRLARQRSHCFCFSKRPLSAFTCLKVKKRSTIVSEMTKPLRGSCRRLRKGTTEEMSVEAFPKSSQ